MKQYRVTIHLALKFNDKEYIKTNVIAADREEAVINAKRKVHPKGIKNSDIKYVSIFEIGEAK